MDTAARLGTGAAVLALVFASAWGAGAALNPSALPPPAPPPAPVLAAPPVAPPAVPPPVPGRVVVLSDVLEPGVPGELALVLATAEGAPVTAAAVDVTVARRDAAGVQHPALAPGPDGVWRGPLTLPAAGVWTVVVDTVPAGGTPVSLTADLFAPGPFTPVPLAVSRVAQAGDYQVRLDGELVAGAAAPVFATVSLAGVPVTDLQPHEGGFGRLVAVRRGDLAHVVLTPDTPVVGDADRAGPGIAFTARVPGPGGYRLLLEFRHGGAVHGVEFALEAR